MNLNGFLLSFLFLNKIWASKKKERSEGGKKGLSKTWFGPLENEILHSKYSSYGTSLVVQWLRLWASTAGGACSISGQRTKISHTMAEPKKKKK